jgi:hypothetical protein
MEVLDLLGRSGELRALPVAQLITQRSEGPASTS